MNEINVNVKLLASLKYYFNNQHLTLKLREGANINDLLNTLNNILKEKGVNVIINDMEHLILINKIHISALNGLKTSLKSGDEVTIIPLIHGG